MKSRRVPLFVLGLAAALFAAGAQAQDRKDSVPQGRAALPKGVLGILPHGAWQCALPGDAAKLHYIEVPAEAFRIGTASSYVSPDGSGIYLMRGSEVLFTRGPKKDQRFRLLGDNTLQKLNADGSPSKLICTRLGELR